MTHRIAAVLGQFHRTQTTLMLETVQEYAHAHNLEIIEPIWVPGAMEKPLAIKQLLMRPDIHGAVALGIIERGETKNGLVLAQTVFPALMQLQLDTLKPVGLGILGPEIFPSQIPSRLAPKAKGAIAAVHQMLQLNLGMPSP